MLSANVVRRFDITYLRLQLPYCKWEIYRRDKLFMSSRLSNYSQTVTTDQSSAMMYDFSFSVESVE